MMGNRNINDPMGGHRVGDTGNGAPGGGRGDGGWGPSTQNKGQWNNPGPKNNNSWDLESPNMQRREGGGRGGGGMGGSGMGGTDDGGTSHWGFKPPGPQGSAPGPAGTIVFLSILKTLGFKTG